MTTMLHTSTQREVLNMECFAKAYQRFRSLGVYSQALRKCLDAALLGFSHEESFLQKNAQLLIHCEGTQLEFVSGSGESIIEVTFVQGEPSYQVRLPQFGKAVETLPCGLLVLSVENLEKIIAEIIGWREVTRGLMECLECGLDHFAKEPFHIQKNSRMVIQEDGRKLELISGDGKNFIQIFQNPEGKCQYDIQLPSFQDRIRRNVFMCLPQLCHKY